MPTINGIDESVYIYGYRKANGDLIPGITRFVKIKPVPAGRSYHQGWNTDGMMNHYAGKYIALKGSTTDEQPFENSRRETSRWHFLDEQFEFTAASPAEFLKKVPDADKAAIASQLGLVAPKTVAKAGAAKATAISSAPKKGTIMSLTESLLAANKVAAAQESKRQLGKVILGQLEARLADKMPEAVRPILNTPVGKYVLANIGVGLASMYTGAQADKLQIVQEALMAAAASEIGDSLNINGLIDGFINSDDVAKLADTAKTVVK